MHLELGKVLCSLASVHVFYVHFCTLSTFAH